jgi:hypothetical protein
VDGDDGALGVVGAGEQHRGFDLLEALGVALDLSREVGEDILTFARQLEESVEIGGTSGQLGFLVEGFLEPLPILVDLLALFGLVPEIGRRGLLFEFCQLSFFSGGVKDSSAQSPIAGGAWCIRVRVRRGSWNFYFTTGELEEFDLRSSAFIRG